MLVRCASGATDDFLIEELSPHIRHSRLSRLRALLGLRGDSAVDDAKGSLQCAQYVGGSAGCDTQLGDFDGRG